MTARIERVSISRDVYELRKQRSRVGKAVSASQQDRPAKDVFTVAATPASTYPLTSVPTLSSLGSSLHLSWGGLGQVEGADYTVDYTTGVVTLDASLVALLAAGDVLCAEYETTGQLIASSTAAGRLVEFVGATNITAGLWGMSTITAGRRLSGTWAYSAVTLDEQIDEGVADAYSIESTVTSAPAGTAYFDWHACTSDTSTGTLTGVLLDTDNSGSTLYLYQAGSVALSTAGAFPAPGVGDVIKVVTDFTTKVATAYRNGVAIHTLNFSTATWFTAGMVAP